MMISREESLKNCIAFMKELRGYCEKEQPVALVQLSKVHNITSAASTILLKYKFLLALEKAKTYTFLFSEETDEEVAKRFVKARAKYYKFTKNRVEKKSSRNEPEEKTTVEQIRRRIKKPIETISVSVGSIADVVQIGLKYGISPKDISDFTEHIINIGNKNNEKKIKG